MARIYLSSTYADLREHRAAVYQALRALRHDVIAMEDYLATDERPVDRCLADVAASEIYVGVFALRYGYVPEDGNPDGLSVTELEYHKAGEAGIPRLVFLTHDQCSWPVGMVDGLTGEGQNGQSIRRLRSQLKKERIVDFFSGVEDLARKVATAVSNHCAGRAAGAIAAGKADFDLDRYFKGLRRRYARLDLDGLTPPKREEYLQVQLRSVFVEQDVRSDARPVELPKGLWERLITAGEVRREDLPAGLDGNELRSVLEAYRGQPARPVLEVLAEPEARAAVLLGDPGSGKSTLARYLVLALAEHGEPKLADLNGHLPLLIELREYAGLAGKGRCETFLDFVDHLARTEHYGFNRSSLEHYLVSGGPALVIFDGLDELFDPGERETITRQIGAFADQFPGARVVVTSRIVGYQDSILRDAGFAHLTLQDLTTEQVDRFVHTWYQVAMHDRPQQADLKRQGLLASVEASPSIRELAGNPMLLTILAIIGKHQELPRERWRVYEHAAEVLIEHWDVNKHLTAARTETAYLDDEDKKELLRRVAVRMQEGDDGPGGNHLDREALQAEFEGYLVDRYRRDPADAKVAAKAMINQFRERNFILSRYGGGLYGFVHRALLEFFCAQHLVLEYEKRQNLKFEQLRDDVFGKRWRDDAWTEVLRLVCGMLDQRFAGQLISWLLTAPQFADCRWSKEDPPRNVALAVQCLAELRDLKAASDQAELVIGAVTELFEGATRQGWGPLGSFLERTIDPAVAALAGRWPERDAFADWLHRRGLYSASQYGRSFLADLAGDVLAGSEQHRADLERLASAAGRWRTVGLWALARGWRDDPRTLDIVLRHAKDDGDYDVRDDAIRLLGQHWREDPRTLPLLRQQGQSDSSDVVRATCLRLIGQHWRDDLGTFSLLRERALDDGRSSVRSACLRSLAEHWKDDDGIRLLIRARAAEDPSDSARSAALAAMGQRWPDHPDTRPYLVQRARDDNAGRVRGAAVEAVANGWKDDVATLPFVLERAADDPDDRGRALALRALANHWPGDENARTAVQRAAEASMGPESRRAAVDALVKGWKTHAATMPLLRSLVTDSLDPTVRGAAARALVREWRSEPWLRPLLTDRAVHDPAGMARVDMLRALAAGWPDEPETYDLLKDRTRRDGDGTAYGGAIDLLCDQWPTEPDTLPLVRDVAMRLDGWPRWYVLWLLARSWPDDPKTLPLIRALTKDNEEAVAEWYIVAIYGMFSPPGQRLDLFPWMLS